MVKPYKTINGKKYTLFKIHRHKREANREANYLREKYDLWVRIIKEPYGWVIYTRSKYKG